MSEENTKRDLLFIGLFFIGVIAIIAFLRFAIKGPAVSITPDEQLAARRAAEVHECGSYCKHGMLRIEWKDGHMALCECAYPSE
jgi:hypothetical protein